MRLGVVVVGLLSSIASAQEQPVQPAQVRFQMERPIKGVLVPRYSIELRADGTGSYKAEIAAPAGAAAADVQPIQPIQPIQPVERPLSFTPSSVKAIFDAVHQLRASVAETPCESKVKHVADTGKKTLTYRDAEGEGSCTYNFSENKSVVQLTEFFQGVETTLEEGRALDFKHRFDRLGLDAEMIALGAAAESGRAAELGVIAPTLRSIAGDTELIQRVRLRAARLLEQAGQGNESTGFGKRLKQ